MPRPASYGRKGRPWERLRAQVRARREPCWICGQPIDYDLPAGHPKSFEADHILPRSMHPESAMDPKNLRAAHKGCNSRRGNRNVQSVRNSTVRNSRDW